jgi:hypothetical protein
MNRAIKTIIMYWLSIFFLVCATQLHADGNSGTTIVVNQTPNFRILDKWRGSWKVTEIRHQPNPKTLTYDLNYEWVINERFLRGETSQKSDGSKVMSMGWYDVFTKSIRFVIFDSAGFAIELPPPTWDEKTQTMEWDTGLLSPVKYTGRTTFPNKDTMQWNAVLKDWKGTVIVDVEGTSIRRK